MDKKRTFHHAKKDEDDDEKKTVHHHKVEEIDDKDDKSIISAGAKRAPDEELDPLDDESQKEEPPKQAAQEQDADEQEETAEPAQAEDDQPQDGPKINFDYPQQSSYGETARPNRVPQGQTMDDLAQEGEEEYDQTQQAVNQPAHPAPRPNPYAQQSPESEYGMRSIRQPQTGPSFPAPGQYGRQGGPNMNGDNGGFRPQGQSSGNPNSNFNFRRDGNYRSGGSNKIYFIVLLFIGLIVLGGAVYLLKNQLKPAALKPTPTPEAVVESTPKPTPTPVAIDRSQFTIRVLNGTDKTGLAGTVADKLKTSGYKIEKTANATNSAFQQTQVRTKNSATGLNDQLIKDLSDQGYSAASASALKSSDTSDGEVILGTK